MLFDNFKEFTPAVQIFIPLLDTKIFKVFVTKVRFSFALAILFV